MKGIHICVLLVVCTGYVVSQDNLTETYIANAAFQDIAPCACDLTEGACDIGCCCDGQCTDDLKATFTCIPGLEGGLSAPVTEFNCKSDHFNKPDWFPLLCIEWEYNALLGFFYNWQYKIGNNTQNFMNRLSTVPFFSYRETEGRRADEVGKTTVGYAYGISIKTGRNTGGSQRGMLALPQPVLNGYCLSVAPVQFLKDLESSCLYRMSIGRCDNYTELSPLFYIQNSTLDGFSVLQEDLGSVLAPTKVTYYCLGTNACNKTHCVGPNDLTDLTTLTPCPTNTPTINYISVSQSCVNTVIYVQYTLTWEGKKVVAVDAAIVLGTVPVQLSGVIFELRQNYKVTYIHSTANVTSPADNFDDLTTTFTRSGRPGYDFDSNVFSGLMTPNNETFEYVDQNATSQMGVFLPDSTGECSSAGRRNIKFGEDLFSSCKENLALSDFDNCTQLRERLIGKFDALMPSDVIGRRGYNDALNLGYWITVLRETFDLEAIQNYSQPITISPVDNITGVCSQIPESVQLEIMYGETGRSNGFPIYEILGAKRSFVVDAWRVRCGGADINVCANPGDTQPFYLSSSVRFIKIPGNTPTPIQSYDLTLKNDEPELCRWDRCWAAMFYPLTNEYTADSKDYVFGMVLIIILFFIGYLMVTRPFW